MKQISYSNNLLKPLLLQRLFARVSSAEAMM